MRATRAGSQPFQRLIRIQRSHSPRDRAELPFQLCWPGVRRVQSLTEAAGGYFIHYRCEHVKFVLRILAASVASAGRERPMRPMPEAYIQSRELRERHGYRRALSVTRRQHDRTPRRVSVAIGLAFGALDIELRFQLVDDGERSSAQYPEAFGVCHAATG